MEIQIGNTLIGNNQPAYIIAEAGVNHNGDLNIALQLVDKAKEIGADCVKFQTFKAETIITKEAPKANYQLKVTDKSESQFEMLKSLELKSKDYKTLIDHCKELDIQFLSTPYNIEDAIFLEQLGVDAYKIASGQLVELPFLKKVAKMGKPIIISTGMANLAEVYEGTMTMRDSGNNDIVVLQCTTNYPSLLEDANISSMITMGQALDVIIGYSDHVEENYACYAAVANGAKVIEKHFTLDRSMKGPDHKASLDPNQFSQLVKGIRSIEKAMGSKVKSPTPAEIENTTGMRRSIVSLKEIKKGETISEDIIGFKRPATGIEPKYLDKIIGKKASMDISNDIPLQEKMIDW